MDSTGINPLELMLEVIEQNTPQTIWTGAPLEAFRRVANTNRGDIGEEFIRRFLTLNGISVSERASRVSRADMEISADDLKLKLRQKTAAEVSSSTMFALTGCMTTCFVSVSVQQALCSMPGAKARCQKGGLALLSVWQRDKASLSS